MCSGRRSLCEEERARSTPGPRRGYARGRAGVLIVGAVVVMLAAGSLRGALAFGFIDPLKFGRNFDAQAITSEGGERLTVTGTFVCPEEVRNSQFQVEASVLQEATGAVFRDVTVGQCPNSTGTFTIEGPVNDGSPAFEAGRALACGLAATSRGAPINSVAQWCSFVSIVEE
jgi:hypothetical protein